MKEMFVVFTRLDELYVTTLDNYESRIPNVNLLNRMKGFTSFDQVVNYMCKYSNTKKDQFIDKTKEEW